MRARRRSRERGTAMVEFALVMVFLVPLMVGSYTVGMNLSRAVQIAALSRSAGSMFVRSVDFSQPSNKDILVRMAAGLTGSPSTAMTRTGGDGVIVLTQVMFAGPNACADGGFTTAGSCPNLNSYVILKRIYIGGRSLRSSSFGDPPDALLRADGTIAPADYLTNAAVRVANFGATLPLNDREFAYAAEVFFRAPQLMLGGEGDGSIYSRNFF